MSLASIWLAVLGGFGAVGALLDIFTRKLPNILCGAMLLAGLGLAFVTGGWNALGLHFAHAALALVVGYGLFAAGIFGGGDGKFYAATAAFFPLWDMLGLFVYITMAGLLLVIVWFGAKRLTKKAAPQEGNFAKLPYGVAIALGAAVFGGLSAG